MSKTATYSKIASTTLGSSVTSYTFSSIPDTYTDLILIINGSATSGTGVYMRYNGDTAGNYNQTTLFTYSGAGAVTDSLNNAGSISLTNMYGTQMIATAQILDYSNTTTYKPMIARRVDTQQHSGMVAGFWRSTSAINSVTISADQAFNSGTNLTLYGIQAVN